MSLQYLAQRAEHLLLLYEPILVMLYCWNSRETTQETTLETTLEATTPEFVRFNAFFVKAGQPFMLTSGHAAGFDHYAAFFTDGTCRRDIRITDIANMDIALLQLDGPRPRVSLGRHGGIVTTNLVRPGDRIVVLGWRPTSMGFSSSTSTRSHSQPLSQCHQEEGQDQDEEQDAQIAYVLCTVLKVAVSFIDVDVPAERMNALLLPCAPAFRAGSGDFVGYVRGNGENIVPVPVVNAFLNSLSDDHDNYPVSAAR